MTVYSNGVANGPISWAQIEGNIADSPDLVAALADELDVANRGAFPGSSSGTTTLQASATASGTLTLPAATDTLVGKATTDTFTNKRITRRVGSAASSASLTIDSDSYDMYILTALAEACTINAPSGTPTQGQELIVRVKDDGTARALSWNAAFRAVSSATIPATTVLGKVLYVGFLYNSTESKWDMVGYAQQS